MSMWWNHAPIRELRQRIRVRRNEPRYRRGFPVVGYRFIRQHTRKNTQYVERGSWSLRLDHRAENFCIDARGFYPMRSHTNRSRGVAA
jgi:hypothetical protein